MAQKTARRTRVHPKRDNTTLIIAGGIAAVVVVALLVWLSLSNTRTPTAPSVALGKTWGQANAPVTIEEYSDFQ
jgi:hypothetical protein